MADVYDLWRSRWFSSRAHLIANTACSRPSQPGRRLVGLEVGDDGGQRADEGLAVLASGGHGVAVLRGGVQGVPELPRTLGEEDQHPPPVARVQPALDEPVPFHAVERPRHRGLLDADLYAELRLRLPVPLVEREQLREL